MMLERGHAPVSATDTDTYLSNPIENNRYLLAPDVNYDDSDVVRDSKFVPFGNGKKYVCIASTVGYQQIQNNEMGEVGSSDSWGTPTYSDTADWYGYQLQVNGYGFGNGKDYTTISAPVNMYNRPNSMMPTGLDVYAIPADDTTFLSDVKDKSPAFLRTIQAFFVVDESMITLKTKLTFLGHTIYNCIGSEKELAGYNLEKGMFGFDTELQRFTKLYTYPYSRIEVSDNTGNVAEVRIENTGKIGMRMLTSVAFPILDFRVFLTGVNGVGSQTYSWRNLNNDELSKVMPNGDWNKYLFEFDIPMFAIYMDAETAWYLDSYGTSVSQARRNALTAYHNTVRSANLGYTNNTASTNNAHDNAVRQADTAQTNGLASNDTANTNAQNSATTANTNAQNSATTMHINTDNMAQCNYDNINLSITANTANVAEANQNAWSVTTYSAERNQSDTSSRNTVSQVTAKEENETSIATTDKSTIGNAIISATNGAMSGAMSGSMVPGVGTAIGAIAGGIMGIATAGVSAATASSNAQTIAQANTVVMNATVQSNNDCLSNSVTEAQNVTTAGNHNRSNQNDNTNTCLAGQRDNNYNTTTTNAQNTHTTQSGNSNRTYNTDSGNATRTKNTADSNTNRTHETSVTNADNTQSTDNTNTGRTREIGILNAKETLENAQATARANLYDARRKAPVQLTNVSGDGAQMYYGMNGLQFKLRTQSDSAITQTATQFARFGYTLNQIWDVATSGLNLMQNFTYWKAADIWVDVRNVASSEISDTIIDIFKRGVTVWRNPDKIGKVGIYDN
jgi:hypothetical protein